MIDGQADRQSRCLLFLYAFLSLSFLGSFLEFVEYGAETRRDAIVREIPQHTDIDLEEISCVIDGIRRKLNSLKNLGNLLGGSVPVFRRKGVKSDIVDRRRKRAAQWLWLIEFMLLLISFANESPNQIYEASGTLQVARGSREVPLGVPASIAIADQSDVFGDVFSLGVLFEQQG